MDVVTLDMNFARCKVQKPEISPGRKAQMKAVGLSWVICIGIRLTMPTIA